MDTMRFDTLVRSLDRRTLGGVGAAVAIARFFGPVSEADAKKRKKKCVKDGSPCPTTGKGKCCSGCSTLTNTCSGGCSPDPAFCQGRCGLHTKSNGCKLDCGPLCDAGKTCNISSGMCEDAGGMCSADASYCRLDNPACGDRCACGSGTCADCAVYLSPDPVTNDACASVGLPEGSAVGVARYCPPFSHQTACLTPCGTCTGCSCVQSAARAESTTGKVRIVGYKSLGKKRKRA